MTEQRIDYSSGNLGILNDGKCILLRIMMFNINKLYLSKIYLQLLLVNTNTVIITNIIDTELNLARKNV